LNKGYEQHSENTVTKSAIPNTRKTRESAFFQGGRGKTHALEKFLQGLQKDLQGLQNL
jgi:hypothetical protein